MKNTWSGNMAKLFVAGLGEMGHGDIVKVVDADTEGYHDGIEVFPQEENLIVVGGWIEVKREWDSITARFFGPGRRGEPTEFHSKVFERNEGREAVAYSLGKMLEMFLLESLDIIDELEEGKNRA